MTQPTSDEELREQIETILTGIEPGEVKVSLPDGSSYLTTTYTLAADDIMQLIKQRDKAALESTRIMGKSIDEVVTILRALDIERVTDIKVTMSNLDKLYEKLRDDIEQGILKARKAAIEQLSTPTDQKEKE